MNNRVLRMNKMEEEIRKLLNPHVWMLLQNMCGNSHCSIIGLISTSWINLSNDHNFVLDGATKAEGLDHNTRYADIILCKGKNESEYVAVVEVESNPTEGVFAKGKEKIENMSKYFKDKKYKKTMEYALLYLGYSDSSRADINLLKEWIEGKEKQWKEYGMNIILILDTWKKGGRASNLGINNGIHNHENCKVSYVPYLINGEDYGAEKTIWES